MSAVLGLLGSMPVFVITSSCCTPLVRVREAPRFRLRFLGDSFGLFTGLERGSISVLRTGEARNGTCAQGGGRGERGGGGDANGQELPSTITSANLAFDGATAT